MKEHGRKLNYVIKKDEAGYYAENNFIEVQTIDEMMELLKNVPADTIIYLEISEEE